MSDQTEKEHGYKWWLRYVIVPLFGGGGIIAIVVALIGRPPTTPPATAIVVPQTTINSTTLDETSEPEIQELNEPTEDAPINYNTLAFTESWEVTSFEDFSNGADHWKLITDPNGTVALTFDLTFNLDTTTDGKVVYAFYENNDIFLGEQFSVSMEAASSEQTGCDYGVTFRMNPNKEYYWFYINGTKYGLNRKASGQESYFDKLIPLTDLPNDLTTISTLAVVGEGTSYKLYVNNQLVDEFNDGRVSGTKAGIGTITCQYLESGSFIFDNFEVREPR